MAYEKLQNKLIASGFVAMGDSIADASGIGHEMWDRVLFHVPREEMCMWTGGKNYNIVTAMRFIVQWQCGR